MIANNILVEYFAVKHMALTSLTPLNPLTSPFAKVEFIILLSAKHSDLKFDLLICRTADYIHVYPHVYRRKNCLLSRNQANWGTFQST